MTPSSIAIPAPHSEEMKSQQIASLDKTGERLGTLIEAAAKALDESSTVTKTTVEALRLAARDYFLQPIAEAIEELRAYKIPDFHPHFHEPSPLERLTQLCARRDGLTAQLQKMQEAASSLPEELHASMGAVFDGLILYMGLREQLEQLQQQISATQRELEASDHAAQEKRA